jgi:hypothetical protein
MNSLREAAKRHGRLQESEMRPISSRDVVAVDILDPVCLLD